MKKIYKNPVIQYGLPLLLFFGLLLFNSCEKEEDYGQPRITNIRITDPAKADSSLSGGDLGQLIVIQGENLGSVQHIYFNTEEASFNPTYVTNTNIIVPIPSEFPSEINDQVTVETKGGTATYEFAVDIPSPLISGTKTHYVPDGEEMVIDGNYFYNVESVIFPDNKEATIVSQEPEKLTVIVPEGAGVGKIKVNAVAGEAESDFIFRDTTMVFVNFDNYPICWGGGDYVVNPDTLTGDFPVEPISGNFYYLKNDYAAQTWWIEETVIAYCGGGYQVDNIADYVLRFEMWVGEEWNSNWFEIGMIEAGLYDWKGYEGTEEGSLKNTGWMTVDVSLSNWSFPSKTVNLERFGSYKAEVDATFEFAFDNFRLAKIN